MAYKTLLEFATDRNLFILLAKERAKYLKRNDNANTHKLDKSKDIFELLDDKQNRILLSRLMPPRYKWVRPKKRKVKSNNFLAARKLAEKSLLLSYRRDLELNIDYPYLREFKAFVTHIRERLLSSDLSFESPQLVPILKDKDDGVITCRPLSVYTNLEDKIILALTSLYLTKCIDPYLHPNILSYRKARRQDKDTYRPLDFNDGIRLIRAFRDAHQDQDIYAADCDIKKFYDIIDHDVVRQCFKRILAKSHVTAEGQQQVLHVLDAYLRSYNFYDNVIVGSTAQPKLFNKIKKAVHDRRGEKDYCFRWVEGFRKLPVSEQRQRGVSQGGALSLIIANVVLNDVDQPIVASDDPERLFIRYCDDMILLHTDQSKCQALIQAYTQSLTDHKLHYHDFKPFTDYKGFWKVKSHLPFLWGDGPVGSSNRYIGFLGYELRRDGHLRLRKSNMDRIRERFLRQVIIHHRMAEDQSEEVATQKTNDTFDHLLDVLSVYTAFDKFLFENGSQYHHLLWLRHKMSDRLGININLKRK